MISIFHTSTSVKLYRLVNVSPCSSLQQGSISVWTAHMQATLWTEDGHQTYVCWLNLQLGKYISFIHEWYVVCNLITCYRDCWKSRCLVLRCNRVQINHRFRGVLNRTQRHSIVYGFGKTRYNSVYARLVDWKRSLCSVLSMFEDKRCYMRLNEMNCYMHLSVLLMSKFSPWCIKKYVTTKKTNQFLSKRSKQDIQLDHNLMYRFPEKDLMESKSI